MIYSDNPPPEQVFVVRLGNCIRHYNAIQSMPEDASHKAQFENDLKNYSEERKQLENQIGEKHRLNYYAYKKIVNDLYAEMNEADKGFSTGEGSPMWARIAEFVDKFAADIKKATEAAGV